ncbi:THAP domain-containing protein 1-like [Maniola hyperantus]|uniref:THAP domain-containing protein 1-like n=1 Tax=Aphantopus hyperantus TaxID=2795564 RepID=UPI001567F358|nr:uncharacterized protein LOC117991294 [Maniola hyperantus]
MPSCVVKSCKNNSMDVRKDTGVTFHKFPKDMSWKHKWTKVVRECRSQESWVPSKFSVVCSVHFAEGDIYITQGGNRRITKNAVPKLKLYDKIPKKKKGEYIPPVETVSVSVQTAYIGPGDEETDNNEMITGDRVESTGDRIENVIIKVEPADITEETAEIETQTGQVNDIIVKVEPKEPLAAPASIEISIDPLASQQDPEGDTGLLCDSSNYKQEIKRKNDQLTLCRTKIKILHQKVHRYQRRNLKLKNILKEIKQKKLIDKDVFRQLTACLVKNDENNDD